MRTLDVVTCSCRLALASAALLTLLPARAHAQFDLTSRLSSPVQFSGEVGSFGELYSISGREQRRPTSTGRLYLRSRLELFQSLTVNLDLLYSTESGSGVLAGSTGRQSLNQIGIAPEWSWGRAYAGTFHDTYSSLTYDGVQLRGAGANLTPGPLRLAAFRGRAQSAVVGGAIDGAYARTMTGGKIGLGRRSERGEGGYVDIVFVRTADDPTSLPPAGISSEEMPSGGSHMVNEFAVTPEENVVVAAVTRMSLWDELIVVSGELAASMHSRDRRAPELSDEALDEYSGLLRSFITPRASTYGDIAHNAHVELRRLELPGSTRESPKSLSATVGYKYIGAGYVSLGLASLPADQQAINGGLAVRFRTWNASVQGMQQHDNLIGQKLATTTRNRFAVSATFRPSRLLSSSVRASINTVGSDTDDVERRVDFTSLALGGTQTLTLGRERLRALALSYGYQQAGDANPLRAGSTVRAHDASLRATFAATRSISVNPAIGLAFSDVGDTGWSLRHTYSLAAQYRAEGGRWSSSASLSNSRLNAGGAIQGAVSSRYRITDGDVLTLSLRSNRVDGLATESGTFHEHTLSLNWTRSIR